MPRQADGATRPLVYICHPYRNDIAGNVEYVTQVCRRLKRSCVPLAPHLLLPAYIDEHTERDLAIEHCLRLVASVDRLMVTDDPSAGMRREIEEAVRLGIPVSWVDL